MTVDDILDLMPIVANQTWTVRGGGCAIRSERNQCPICALVTEISDGAIHQYLAADMCMDVLFRDKASGSLPVSEYLARHAAIYGVVRAADVRSDSRRAKLVAALGMPVGS